LAELFEQPPCIFEVGGVEALGEAVVDVGEQPRASRRGGWWPAAAYTRRS